MADSPEGVVDDDVVVGDHDDVVDDVVEPEGVIDPATTAAFLLGLDVSEYLDDPN